MNAKQIAENIFELSVNAEGFLFEGMWPLPNGVSLNSYIVKGEKTALIDGVCGWDGVPETLTALLAELNIRPESIDYVVVNHMEPDHSGWLDSLRKLNPGFTVICSEKAEAVFRAFLDLNVNIRVVKSGDTLDLWNGMGFQFEYIPNVHWPETMMTLELKTKTLFTCDALGSFGKLGEGKTDADLSSQQIAAFEGDTIRYYADILATFSSSVEQAIKKIRTLQVSAVAPGHGLVWKRDPERILSLYEELTASAKHPRRPEVSVIWGSMYGNTAEAVKVAVETLKREGLTVHEMQVPETHAGELLEKIWTSPGVVLAMPTYEYRMFPPMAAALEELGKKKVLNRTVFRFGSFGWSGGAQKELTEIMEHYKMDWHFIEPVEFRGKPREADFAAVEKGARELAAKVKERLEK